MNTQTTPIRDGLKPVPSPTGDAPAQERGASAGLGGQAPRTAVASLLPIISAIESARERLEIAYNMLKNIMAYVRDNATYTRLEGVRARLVEVMMLINEVIDELPDEIKVVIKDDAPYVIEVIEA
jgi:hypothetical protein